MTVEEVARRLQLQTLAAGPLEREVSGGYASDLLSAVMARAKEGCVWVTVQSHANVIAVASLLNLAAVIVAEDSETSEETLTWARQNGVTVLRSPHTTFTIVSQLSALGILGN